MVFLPYREAFFQHAEQFGSLENHDYLSAVLPLGGQRGHVRRRSASRWCASRWTTSRSRRAPGACGPDIDFLDYGLDNDPTTPDPGQGNGVWEPGERLLLTGDNLYMASSSDWRARFRTRASTARTGRSAATSSSCARALPDTIPGPSTSPRSAPASTPA